MIMKQTGIKIIQQLRDNGHEAVFAGGCVRDMLMGNIPNDYDIATSALPKEVEKLFDKVIYIGKSKVCGTSYVIENGLQFEVTTFRMDFDYDGRHPGKVKFVSMEEDAQRRDFSINGIFNDPINDRIIDFVNGQKDIKTKVIRFIGKPEDRIKEDHLRMLRALRFSDRLKFVLDQESFLAIRRNSYKIQNISKERIRDEIVKTFKSSKGLGFLDYLFGTCLNIFIIPELESLLFSAQNKQFHPEGDVFDHIYDGFNYLENESYLLKLGWLFHDIAKPQTYNKINEKITNHGHAEIGAKMTELILRRLTFSNDEVDCICGLVRDHMKPNEVKNMKKSTFRKLAGQPYFDDLLKLHYADCMASNGDLTAYNLALKRFNEFKNEPILPEPLIKGQDLIALGFQEGKEIGEVKKSIYDIQLEGKIKTVEDGLVIANKLLKQRRII